MPRPQTCSSRLARRAAAQGAYGSETSRSRLPRHAETLAALLGAAIVATRYARQRVRHLIVAGYSMAPTLLPGDRLVAVRIGRSPRPGDLVVGGDPRAPRRLLVKRVHAVAEGQVDLRGDNPAASTDSRTFGALPVSAVDACVVWRYHPPARAGRVSSSRARVCPPRSRPAAPR